MTEPSEPRADGVPADGPVDASGGEQPATEPDVPVTDRAGARAVSAGAVPTTAGTGADDAVRAGRGRRLAVLAAVLLVPLGLAAVAALLLTRSQDAATVASYYRPSSAPMNAARDAGRLLFSYDHRTIDEDFAAAKALTTGTFAEEYERTTSTVVRPVAVENKAVVEASAVSQAIAEAGPGRVVALVFVNQVTTSSVVQGQKVDQSRVRMTLVERDGGWKVSKVEAL